MYYMAYVMIVIKMLLRFVKFQVKYINCDRTANARWLF